MSGPWVQLQREINKLLLNSYKNKQMRAKYALWGTLALEKG